MTLTWVDWAFIAVVVISSLISLRRGFVKEALSLLTWIVAGVIAWMFGGALSHYLADYISTPSFQVIAACAILFVLTLLVGALINFLIGELVRVTGLSGTDRFLGMADCWWWCWSGYSASHRSSRTLGGVNRRCYRIFFWLPIGRRT